MKELVYLEDALIGQLSDKKEQGGYQLISYGIDDVPCITYSIISENDYQELLANKVGDSIKSSVFDGCGAEEIFRHNTTKIIKSIFEYENIISEILGDREIANFMDQVKDFGSKMLDGLYDYMEDCLVEVDTVDDLDVIMDDIEDSVKSIREQCRLYEKVLSGVDESTAVQSFVTPVFKRRSVFEMSKRYKIGRKHGGSEVLDVIDYENIQIVLEKVEEHNRKGYDLSMFVDDKFVDGVLSIELTDENLDKARACMGKIRKYIKSIDYMSKTPSDWEVKYNIKEYIKELYLEMARFKYDADGNIIGQEEAVQITGKILEGADIRKTLLEWSLPTNIFNKNQQPFGFLVKDEKRVVTGIDVLHDKQKISCKVGEELQVYPGDEITVKFRSLPVKVCGTSQKGKIEDLGVKSMLTIKVGKSVIDQDILFDMFKDEETNKDTLLVNLFDDNWIQNKKFS